MKFIKTDQTNTITEFRTLFYQKLTTALDAMWEKLHIASAQHYLIEHDGKNIGYCCIDDKDSLLQFFLGDSYNYITDQAIKALIESKLISTASLSSIEPVSFNTCLLHSTSIKANTFCFQYVNPPPLEQPDLLAIELASIGYIPEIKAFLNNQIGFNDNFGYTENLVDREEYYLVKEGEVLIATSECRWSDSQPEFADLGVIVNKNYQRKGIATQVLKQQAQRVLKAGRKPICSTTIDNIASRKAIEKAGFYCSHIIFDMELV